MHHNGGCGPPADLLHSAFMANQNPSVPDFDGSTEPGISLDPADLEATTDPYLAEPESPVAAVADDLPDLDPSMAVPDLVKWEADDYAFGSPNEPVNYGHSALKLVDSAVAPLVAAARGYTTFDHTSVERAYKEFPLPRRNTKQGRRFADSIAAADVLVMPWFVLLEVDLAQRKGRDAVPTTIQYRPAVPQLNDKGKEVKYEFVTGQDTPLGLHPSVPREWIDDAPVVLIAEGLLKGDAALSAYLLANGSTVDDLRYDGTFDARARLATLLDRIPPEDRVAILTIGGVGNWRRNPEWRQLSLKGRSVWIGVDGDVTSNHQVHQMASELWDFIKDRHHGKPFLLAPSAVAGDDGEMAKVGIDDYLSHIGTWGSLLRMLSDTMPQRPASDGAADADTYRISEDGAWLEFCKPRKDEFDRVVGGAWERAYPMGGRLVSMGGSRVPRNDELRSGTIDIYARPDEGTEDVEVEVSWMAEDGSPVSHSITGPATILNHTTEQWSRHGARIPNSILKNPNWPIRKTVADEWVRAVKASRSTETMMRTRWDAMGWVLTSDGVPAFIIGEQVLGVGEGEVETTPGVTEAELAGTSRFGVGDLDSRSFDDADYRADLRDDICKMLDVMVKADVWTDDRNAAVVVAAGLRPCLPVRPSSSVTIVGPRRKGKSMTAAAIMGFWARRPGDWTGSGLPGSAKDSTASMELSLARSVIWVADDLAPANSRRQAEAEQDNIGTVIRNVFNNSARGRANASMGMRKKHLPRALLVVTAENEPIVSSVRDRCVMLNIGHGSLNPSRVPTDRLDALCTRDGAPARVAQGLIRFLQWQATRLGQSWTKVYDTVLADHAKAQAIAAEKMSQFGSKEGDSKRHAELASDLVTPLLYLLELAIVVGVPDEYLDLLGTDGLVTKIVSLVAEGDLASNETTPGRALVHALAASLNRLACHVINAEDPATPPGDKDGSARLAPFLGWQPSGDGTPMRPIGDRIGALAYIDGEPVIFFDHRTAFLIAQKNFPDLIPAGQGQRASWGSLVGEGFARTDLLEGRSGNRQTVTTARKRVHGVDYTGVPVALKVLLRGEGEAEPELPNLAGPEDDKTGHAAAV